MLPRSLLIAIAVLTAATGVATSQNFRPANMSPKMPVCGSMGSVKKYIAQGNFPEDVFGYIPNGWTMHECPQEAVMFTNMQVLEVIPAPTGIGTHQIIFFDGISAVKRWGDWVPEPSNQGFGIYYIPGRLI